MFSLLRLTSLNVWAQLKADLGEAADTVNRVYSVDIDDIQKCMINDGYKDVEVSMLILGESEDKKPVRIGAKKDEE